MWNFEKGLILRVKEKVEKGLIIRDREGTKSNKISFGSTR
jgi:hypothetical protein